MSDNDSDNDSRPASGFKRLSQEDAQRRSISMHDYGVYKGSAGSVVKPVNSARGLLVLSIILTVLGIGMLLLIGMGIAQELNYIPRPDDYTSPSPFMVVFFAFILIFPVWSWVLYVKERRAQKSRVSKGLPKVLR